MIKHFASAGILLGLSFVAAAPASAADCGVLGVLSGCVASPPAPQPVPLALPLPSLDPAPAAVPPPPAPATPPVLAAPAPVAAAQKLLVAAAADRILQLVNRERAGAGLPARHSGAAGPAGEDGRRPAHGVGRRQTRSDTRPVVRRRGSGRGRRPRRSGRRGSGLLTGPLPAAAVAITLLSSVGAALLRRVVPILGGR